MADRPVYHPATQGRGRVTRPVYHPATQGGGVTTRPVYHGQDTGSTGPHHSHGWFDGMTGFYSNLAHGAEDAARGFGPALATAGKDIGEYTWNRKKGSKQIKRDIVKPMERQYAKTYGPLVHGDLRGFGHQVYTNPFPVLLDAAAVATGGAGAIAGGGSKLADLGVISDASRLAHLRDVQHLTVPDLAKQAGQGGRDVLIKRSSANPLIRARQVAVNRALNSRFVHDATPVIGSQARYARVVSRADREARALSLKSAQFKAAFGRLNKNERAAWHMRARQLDPELYRNLILSRHAAHPLEGTTEAEMLKRLDDPKLKALVAKGSRRLDDALAKGHALSELMSHEKVSRGLLDEQIAKESPYLAQRLAHGARVVGKDDVVVGGDSKLTAAQARYVDRLQKIYDRAHERTIKSATLQAAHRGAIVIGHRVVGKGSPVYRSATLEEAKAELAVLDKKYNDFVDQFMQKKLTPDQMAEQRLINQSRGRYVRQNSGKTKAGKWSGASGSKSPFLKTVNENMRMEMEAELHRLAEANPEQGQGFLDLSRRQDELRTAIGQHEEQSVGTLSDDAERQREIEAVRADPASWDYHTGRPQLTRAAAKKMDEIRAGRERPADLGKTHVGDGPGVAFLAHHGARAEQYGSALSIAKTKLEQMRAADANRLAKKGGPISQGVHDAPGHSLEELIARNGEQQPFYVPDSAETRTPLRSRNLFRSRSVNPPGKLGSANQNLGTLLTKGMINLHGDSLSSEFGRFARHVGRADVSAALKEGAAKVPEGGLTRGYVYLKEKAGERGAPYTKQVADQVRAELKSAEDKGSLKDRFTTRDPQDPNIAVDGEGHQLMIPERIANLLTTNARSERGLVTSILFEKPTSIWKHLVLGLRPAYMANIILSQHVLGALQMAPGANGVAAYLNHLIPGARLGKLTDHTIEDVMPEQSHATFSDSAGATSNKGLRVSSAAYQGVMPATLKVENWLRRLMIEGWASSTPEVRAAMRDNGGDINLAMRQVAKTDPDVLHEISLKVDHAQGNYRTYSPAEQKVRSVIPFYGWDRHIVQSTYRLLADYPIRSAALVRAGQQGHAINERDFGALPTYLQDLVKIHLPHFMGPIAGRVTGVSTKSISPFQADADLGELAGSLVHGQAGAHMEEAANINPLITGIYEQLSGRSSVTGQPLKDHMNYGLVLNTVIRTGLNVPQAKIVTEALGFHPLGTPPANPASVTNTKVKAAALLGISVHQLDLAHEHLIAGLQHTPPK